MRNLDDPEYAIILKYFLSVIAVCTISAIFTLQTSEIFASNPDPGPTSA